MHPSNSEAPARGVLDALERMAPRGVLSAAAAVGSANSPSLRRACEHRLGRALAGDLLVQLGCQSREVGRGANNEPLWPEGVCGSISHSGEVCVAVLAPSSVLGGIGVDVEVVADVERALWPSFATEAELARIRSLPVERQAGAAAALFSAKEAAYKCVFPMDGEFLEFHEVELDLDLGIRSFHVTFGPERSPSLSSLAGSFELTGSTVVTLATVAGQVRHFS